jgi:hypothetical protein
VEGCYVEGRFVEGLLVQAPNFLIYRENFFSLIRRTISQIFCQNFIFAAQPQKCTSKKVLDNFSSLKNSATHVIL